MSATVMKVDHLRLILDEDYLMEVARRFGAAQKGKLMAVSVVHEAHDECCAVEPWPRTSHRLQLRVGTVGERG
ncbi:MAG: hypothetical protein ACREOA_07015 [Candidatus Dormibacteria bacterium]